MGYEEDQRGNAASSIHEGEVWSLLFVGGTDPKGKEIKTNRSCQRGRHNGFASSRRKSFPWHRDPALGGKKFTRMALSAHLGR
jgi:hypothetical protein